MPGQAPELRDERQQRFGERVLVQADGERLALGLPPVDLGLAVVGKCLVVLRRRAEDASHREERREQQTGEPSTLYAHAFPLVQQIVIELVAGETIRLGTARKGYAFRETNYAARLIDLPNGV